MPVYKYKVINNEGKKIEGNFTANSQNEVLAMIRENNYYAVSIEEARSAKKNFSLSFGKVKLKELAIFCRQFYTMLNAGSTITNTIDVLRKQGNNEKLKKSLDDIMERVQKGQALSESMGEHKDVFPEMLVSMIAAGEISGNLDGIMQRMAVHYEKENKIAGKIKGALAYPIVLMVMSLAVVNFLLVFVMPTFVGMFEGSGTELPQLTKVVISISEFVQAHILLLLIVILIIIVGISYVKKSPKVGEQMDALKFKIPVVGDTTSKIITSRFTRTMSTMLYSGISIVQCVEASAKVLENDLVAKKILKGRENLIKGSSLSEVIENIKEFPLMLSAMIKIGEESGSLDDILEKTADFYDNEVEEAIQKVTTMIEPIMILIMGVLVGTIVIAMVLPMFDMFNAVQGM